MQNKFLRTILDAQYDIRIVNLHREAKIEIDQVIAELLDNSYKHDNLFIRNTDNYNIETVPFQIRCRLLKHFQSIKT